MTFTDPSPQEAREDDVNDALNALSDTIEEITDLAFVEEDIEAALDLARGTLSDNVKHLIEKLEDLSF